MWGVTAAPHRRMCEGILSLTKFPPAKKGGDGGSKNVKLFYRNFDQVD